MAGGVEEEEGSPADAVEDSPAGSSRGGAPKSKGEKKTEGNGNRHSPLDKPGSARTPKSGISSKPSKLVWNELVEA